MKKKFAAALFAVMMAGSVMAGCGEKPAEPTPVTVTKEEPKAEAPASVSRETAERYILGITDRFVLEGAKDVDFLARKEALDKVITEVKVDDSAVDTTKPGTYKVRYTVTVNVKNLEKAEAYVAEHPEALETAAIPAQEPAVGQVQAEGAVTHARVPYRPVTVNKEACYLVANHLDGLGLLSVGKGHNLARLSASKDVIAVGSQSRDVLVHEVAVTLQCVVRHIDTAHTFVSAYPQVVVVALYDAVYCQLAGRNQLMFHAVTVQS